MESSQDQLKLGELVVGTRLLVRSKKDWRFAVVSRKTDEFISLSIASPSGYNYRIRRDAGLEIGFDGPIPFIAANETDAWRDNFSTYDVRW